MGKTWEGGREPTAGQRRTPTLLTKITTVQTKLSKHPTEIPNSFQQKFSQQFQTNPVSNEITTVPTKTDSFQQKILRQFRNRKYNSYAESTTVPNRIYDRFQQDYDRHCGKKATNAALQLKHVNHHFRTLIWPI
jgi:ribosomal protein S17E